MIATIHTIHTYYNILLVLNLTHIPTKVAVGYVTQGHAHRRSTNGRGRRPNAQAERQQPSAQSLGASTQHAEPRGIDPARRSRGANTACGGVDAACSRGRGR